MAGDRRITVSVRVSPLYFDRTIYEPKALMFLTETADADRILMDTDYSGDMSAWREVPVIGKPDFPSDNQKQKILSGNTMRLLGLC